LRQEGPAPAPSPAPAPVPASATCMGPTKCAHLTHTGGLATKSMSWVNSFCVGFEGDTPYCYGRNGACKWGVQDCHTDADCANQYNTNSPKNPAGGVDHPVSTGCPISGGPKWASAACACA
jgi:hypothetical protein